MAASTTSMEVIRVDGLSLAARSGSGHWFNMDNSVKGGGHDGAASPMEMVLAGLAGCTAMDVLSMLEKMRARVDDFRIAVTAERLLGAKKIAVVFSASATNEANQALVQLARVVVAAGDDVAELRRVEVVGAVEGHAVEGIVDGGDAQERRSRHRGPSAGQVERQVPRSLQGGPDRFLCRRRLSTRFGPLQANVSAD